MSLNVALTGATGFVGRNVVAELLSQGHSVTAMVRDVNATNLPGAVKIVVGDLETPAALSELTRGADVVVHIAGLISARAPQDYFSVNEVGTRAVCQAAQTSGVKGFVYVSSLSAREPQLSAYGKSKLAGETAALKFSEDMRVIILRPPAVYGPGDRATLPLFRSLTLRYALLPGRASARFSLIHVRDLGRVICQTLLEENTGVFEISDGTLTGYNWAELATIAGSAENKSITPVFLPRFLLVFIALLAEGICRLRGRPTMISREKINELYHLNWVAEGQGWPLQNATLFEQGFNETVAWYRQKGWLPPNAWQKLQMQEMS